MNQRESNTEEKFIAEEKSEGISHDSYETNSPNPFTDAEIQSEQCELETSELILNSQEASYNSIELNAKQDIKAPARGTFLLKSENLDLFGVVPTINVGTGNSHKPLEHVEPMIVGLIDPEVVECLEELIGQVVAVESLLSLRGFQQSPKQQILHNRNYVPKLPHTMDSQSVFENLYGSSSQEVAMNHPGMAPEIHEDTNKSSLKYQRIKFRKDFEMLSAILDEVGRMNDYYRKEIIDKNQEARAIHNISTRVHEGLSILESLPSHDIFVDNEDGEPYCVLNVYEFGSRVFLDCVELVKKMTQFIREYNKFRLKFLDFSEALSLNPLEQLIGSEQNDEIDKIVEQSKLLYKDFFGDGKYRSEFRRLKTDHFILKHNVTQFENYFEILAAQNN